MLDTHDYRNTSVANLKGNKLAVEHPDHKLKWLNVLSSPPDYIKKQQN